MSCYTDYMGISAVLIFVFSFSAWADKFAYPPQKISAAGIHQIKISGVKGHLILREKATKFYRIRVMHSKAKQFEDWNLSMDRVHDALVLEVFNVAYGPQWRKLVRQELWPEFDIEIEGPSVPVLAGWREGRVDISGWRKAIELSFLKGRVSSEHTSGTLKLETVDANVAIKDHQGALDLRGEKGNVELQRVKGRAKIAWLDGDLKGENLKGEYNIEWQSGSAGLKEVNAKVKAKSSGADWKLSARAPSEVEISTDKGAVDIKWLGRGGVKLFLSSISGKIKAPKAYQVESRDGGAVVEASRVGKPKGEAFVRTRSGAISWQFP